MGELKIVKLHFRSALHLGSDVSGIGLEDSRFIAHSDTLFSCLINSYAELHSGDPRTVEKLLNPFREGESPFRISSAFPFQMRTEHTATYYVPKPLVDPPLFYDSMEGQWAKQVYGKLVRNTKLVQINTFKNWLKGEDDDLDELETQNTSSFCMREIRPQHVRDRLTDATTIYHTGLVHFHGRSGLYFLVQLNNKSLLNWEEFRAMLSRSGMNGLGGRRSHGNGIFEITDETISNLDSNWEQLFDLPEQNGFINLSLYLPETFDGLAPVAYQLIPRRGWCYSSVTPTQMKRKTVTMFGEGSVFRNEPIGALADVTPDGFTAHKLYRYGIPISLPINILEKEDDIS
jgi:CRISPR-associated protein Csm4